MTDEQAEYRHPEFLVHMPDFYRSGSGRSHKRKSRTMISVQSAATGLIHYLEWPGDARRDDDPAIELGPFAVYALDLEATARLRESMSAMKAEERWQPVSEGQRWWNRKSEPGFAERLREAIKTAARA